MIVGVAGGSGAGKTTFVARLIDALPGGSTTVLSHDAYYRDLRHLPPDQRARVNFDHPDSLETDLLVAHIAAFRQGRSALVPTYDFVTHTRGDATIRVTPTATVIVEGILLLAHEELRSALDLAVFIDVEDDARLARRLERDIAARGRSPESVTRQWLETVRPMHDAFVRPSIAHADVIVPGGGHNDIAARTIAAYVARDR
jgi:uridine kinase